MAALANEKENNNQVAAGPEVGIRAGELYFGNAPTAVSTILHTRIAISFWHPRTRIGGLCHIIKIQAPAGMRNMQFADCAIDEYAILAEKYGTPVSEYEVTVFGGKVKDEADSRRHEIALDAVTLLLKQKGFKVSEIDAFVTSSRKLILDLSTGETLRQIIGNAEDAGRHASKSAAEEFNMEIFLHPGEIYFGKAPMVISTLLGSCVATTLWHPGAHIGGMCHIVLPESPDGKCEMKYGDCAIAEFVKQIALYSTETKDYVVNIYGGSDMFPGMEKSSGMKIGDRNAEKVKELLELYKFRVNEVDTGGTNSRKIRLDLSDGSVGIRKHGKPVEG